MEANGTVQLEDPRGEVAGRKQSVASREQPDMVTFFSKSSSEYHSNIFDWLFLVQLLINMVEQRVKFYFQSSLAIFIFKSTLLEVILVHPWVKRSASPTSTCSKQWEVWELPLHVPFVFVALPLGGKSNEMDYFGLWEGLPSPWWGYGKPPQYGVFSCWLSSPRSDRA